MHGNGEYQINRRDMDGTFLSDQKPITVTGLWRSTNK